MKKLTYIIGAGASAEALPVVSNFNERLEMFIFLLKEYVEQDIYYELFTLMNNIKNHSTVDTYAKKLYLQDKSLGQPEYRRMINLISSYFIFEQLKKGANIAQPSNKKIKEFFDELKTDTDIHLSYVNDLDIRYDAFFAAILKHDNKDKIIVPPEINVISWNYDSQFEKAYMNYTGCKYDETLEHLNVIGAYGRDFHNVPKSTFVKLNGMAGFVTDKLKCGELFDYSINRLDDISMTILAETVSNKHANYETSIRYAWIKNSESENAILAANTILKNSDIIVVIGYSFPYFNREVDRAIFENVNVEGKYEFKVSGKTAKIYIQSPPSSNDQIADAFRSIIPNAVTHPYTSVNQFLIPNEF